MATSGLLDFSVPAVPGVGSLPIVNARANRRSDGSIQFQERVGKLALADAIDSVVGVHIEGSPEVVAAPRPGRPGASTACAAARIPSES